MADEQRLFDAFRSHPDIAKQPGHSGEAGSWCPWHHDRAGGKPSLGINLEKKIVKCFVCGEGGAQKLAEAWSIEIESDLPPSPLPVKAMGRP